MDNCKGRLVVQVRIGVIAAVTSELVIRVRNNIRVMLGLGLCSG